jgi:hypothetical protein
MRACNGSFGDGVRRVFGSFFGRATALLRDDCCGDRTESEAQGPAGFWSQLRNIKLNAPVAGWGTRQERKMARPVWRGTETGPHKDLEVAIGRRVLGTFLSRDKAQPLGEMREIRSNQL